MTLTLTYLKVLLIDRPHLQSPTGLITRKSKQVPMMNQYFFVFADTHTRVIILSDGQQREWRECVENNVKREFPLVCQESLSMVNGWMDD